MRRISLTVFLAAAILVLNLPGHNQLSVTKTFPPMPDATVLLNPERGFYYVLELTASTDFSPSLSISDVLGSIPTNTQNISILLVEIFLDSFIASDISATVLDKLKNVIFPAVRSLNVKCLVRFAYTNDITSNKIQDAAETQLLRHITQLTPILQANSDLVFVVQAGLIGAWGEWYYSSNYASSVDQSVNAAQKAARNRIVTALLKAVPSDKMIQLRTPSYKQVYCNTTANLTPKQAFSSSYPCARIGIHNDCFMAPWGDEGTFTNDAQRVWLTNEAQYVMTGGESCMVNGNYTSCAGGISQVKAQRFTYLNRDYQPDIISGWVKNGCYNTIANMLGYRFQLINGTFPTSVTRGKVYQATVSLSNTGVAPLYNSRPVQMILRNTATRVLSTFPQSAIDPRRWAPGSTVSLSLSFTIPSTLATGSYDVILNLPDAAASLSNQPLARILFANSGGVQEAKTRYNFLGQVKIV